MLRQGVVGQVVIWLEIPGCLAALPVGGEWQPGPCWPARVLGDRRVELPSEQPFIQWLRILSLTSPYSHVFLFLKQEVVA